MRKWFTTGIAMIVGVLMVGILGWAQEMGPMGREPGREAGGGIFHMRGGEERLGMKLMALLDNDRVKAALGLTDPQTDSLRKILLETAKSTVKTRADMKVREIELADLMRADKPDREAVMKTVQDISDSRGRMMKQQVGALLAAKEVLTPEQQKKIRNFIEMRAAGLGGGERRFGRGMGEPPNGPGPPPQPPRAPAPPSNE